MKKCIVLLSGGVDSTCLLAKLVHDRFDCYPLSIEYGQRHAKELLAAKRVSEYYGLWENEKHKVLFLGNLKELIHSALSGDGDIPHGHYSDDIQKVTVFPNRNMILLGIAAGYAQTIGAAYVAYAAHSNDRAIYPDCRPMFVESVRETIELGTGGDVTLLEPFVNITKAQVIVRGIELGAPLHLTFSCYEGGDRPCLQCGTCLERTEAFSLANVSDPALSGEEWKKALEFLKQYVK